MGKQVNAIWDCTVIRSHGYPNRVRRIPIAVGPTAKVTGAEIFRNLTTDFTGFHGRDGVADGYGRVIDLIDCQAEGRRIGRTVAVTDRELQVKGAVEV